MSDSKCTLCGGDNYHNAFAESCCIKEYTIFCDDCLGYWIRNGRSSISGYLQIAKKEPHDDVAKRNHVGSS